MLSKDWEHSKKKYDLTAPVVFDFHAVYDVHSTTLSEGKLKCSIKHASE